MNTFFRFFADLLLFILLAGFLILGIFKLQGLFTDLNHPVYEPSANSKRISPIYKEFVYDLSGSEASGQSNLMLLFDEPFDAKKGNVRDPATNPYPRYNKNIFFPVGKGWRIVVDLGVHHSITDICIYDKALTSDSIWIYTGDMNYWKNEVAYKTGNSVHNWGWKNFRSNATTRYLMFRFNSPDAIIAEITLFGIAIDALPIVPVVKYEGNILPKPTLREFMGTNSYDLPPLQLIKPFYQTRLYQVMSWYDRDTINDYPHNKLTLNYFNLPELMQVRYYADSIKLMYGNRLWMSVRGLPLYLQKKGMKETDKPVTKPGMDMEDPLSYKRHARTFWNLAALYGYTKVDPDSIDIEDIAPFSGAGIMDRFENGNEEDAYWTGTYWTPAEYFAVSSADYDGHEGRSGTKHGIKQADPNSKLLMSGMIGMDTNRVKVLNFLCQQKRNDKKFIWDGGVQYHYYSNDGKGKFPTTGIGPEADQMRKKLSMVRDFQYRVVPHVPAILGENGYDRNRGSWQKAPLLPGHDIAQSQGILIIRSMIAAFMSGFDAYNHYMLRNATNNENAEGTFATSGMIGGPASSKIYPAWYYWSTVVNALGKYQPAKIISEDGKVWVYKFRHKTLTDSVAYYFVSPTTNGTVIKNFRFIDKRFLNKDYYELRLSDNSVSGMLNKKKTKTGFLEITVGESPVFVLLKE